MLGHKYYLRIPSTADFRGPFTVPEIRQELSADRAKLDWQVVEAVGQSYRQLKRTTNWIPLRAVLDDATSSSSGSGPSSEPSAEDRSDRKQSPRSAPVPDELHHARVLGLRGRVTFEEIKRIYRQRMLEYHPDRVAALGPKLRELAESETKQITAAFEYFRGKYDTERNA